jgi:hypothetical protein
MLWVIFVALLLLWLLGFLNNIGGNLIHLLLVPVAVVVIIGLATGGRGRPT